MMLMVKAMQIKVGKRRQKPKKGKNRTMLADTATTTTASLTLTVPDAMVMEWDDLILLIPPNYPR